jgi:hypothetical protein
MTNKVPELRTFSPKVAESEAIDAKLADTEEALNAEYRRLASVNTVVDDRAERAKILASGGVPKPTQSIAERRAEIASDLADVKAARELHAKNHRDLLYAEGLKLRQSMKPACDGESKRLAAGLAEVFSALYALQKIKNGLEANGVGWWGTPINIDTETLFKSIDRTSDIALLMRECVTNGFLKQLPQELA